MWCTKNTCVSTEFTHSVDYTFSWLCAVVCVQCQLCVCDCVGSAVSCVLVCLQLCAGFTECVSVCQPFVCQYVCHWALSSSSVLTMRCSAGCWMPVCSADLLLVLQIFGSCEWTVNATGYLRRVSARPCSPTAIVNLEGKSITGIDLNAFANLTGGVDSNHSITL